MPENFKPILPQSGESNNSPGNLLKFQIEKLYAEAFPSVASKALFKLEGAKDQAKQAVTDALGLDYKIPNQPERQPLALDWKGVDAVQIDDNNIKSYLGTPIFFPITLKAGNYYVLDNGEAVIKSFPNDLRLPSTATAEFTRAKLREDTIINGTAGSVKELWGFDDWQITIRGLIITEGDHQGKNADIFPQSELSNLYDFENITDAIDVSGVLFTILKIKRITFDKLSLSQIQGTPNVIGFQMFCKSDEAAEIIFNNNQLGNN